MLDGGKESKGGQRNKAWGESKTDHVQRAKGDVGENSETQRETAMKGKKE